ncbi:MAG: hypothetical protein H6712_10385 [Myxococcales bacterium]|nr:hypothetical protein [Myxococcales bacterium]MCB9714255.1 hypothetical protein [Myxococcales bacterium]
MIALFPLLLALAGPGQLLSNPEAQAKLREAQEAFQNEDFDAAAAAVEAAYIIEPKPMLLYPWAQAERSRGNCEAAVELYQRFLDSDPPDEMAGVAIENRDLCQAELDAEQEVIEDDDGSVVDEVLAEEDPEPSPAPVTNDNQPKAKAWYKDPVGGVLVGVGVAGVGAGVGLLAVASSRAKGASEMDTHSEYMDARDGATTLRNGGAIALSIGSALVVGGVVRYLLVAKKGNKDATAWRLSPELGPRWTGVSIGRRF